MKRCFITGKQCIFTPRISDNKAKRPKMDKDLTIFVIIPFKGNFETFYQWSLKPYLIHLGINKQNIIKADESMDMGYIVCEKICKKIQESDLIVADISVENNNIFYELGLAYGLERAILLVQIDSPVKNLLKDPRILNSLTYNHNPETIIRKKILKYQGVQDLHEGLKKPLSDYIINPNLDKNQRLIKNNHILQISFLDFSPDRPEPQITEPGDISLTFHQIMIGAMNAAMTEIKSDILKINTPINEESSNLASRRKEWDQIKQNIDFNGNFYEAHEINIAGAGSSFAKITQEIESSFCTIIDITPGNQDSILAYFWLGYCHSRGLNVIPVFRLKDKEELREIENKLAFDIRSLWFADYYEKKPYLFKKRLQEIMEHLLLRDLPDRQKREFWKRFPPEKKLKVFTGAIPIPYLKREVVGDWDVKTVSELYSYLPLIRETATPPIITPIYSPEHEYNKLISSEKIIREDYINQYKDSIDEKLNKSNSIIIGSPDVNPVCEYVLNRIYEVSESDQEFKPIIPLTVCDQPEFNGYIMVKERKKKDLEKRKKEEEYLLGKDYERFPRLFFIEKEIEDDACESRGFIKHTGTTNEKQYFEHFYSQNEDISSNAEKRFNLIGHLLVAKYPLEDKNQEKSEDKIEDKNFVLLLNGVSGPATFALAQILTGGDTDSQANDFNSNSESERMLSEINWRLNLKEDAIGVQGLVKIVIANNQDPREGRFIADSDIRKIISWSWYPGHPKSIYKRKNIEQNLKK